MTKGNPSNTIILCGDVDENMVGYFTERLTDLDSHKIPGGIIVRITSHGGCVSSGFAIYDSICLARNKVTTQAWGMAESTAVLIFQAGHRRMMAPNSRLVVHDLQGDASTSTGSKGAIAHLNVLKHMENAYMDNIAKRSGRTSEEVLGWCRDVTLFSPQLAVAKGLADGIIGVRQ